MNDEKTPEAGKSAGGRSPLDTADKHRRMSPELEAEIRAIAARLPEGIKESTQDSLPLKKNDWDPASQERYRVKDEIGHPVAGRGNVVAQQEQLQEAQTTTNTPAKKVEQSAVVQEPSVTAAKHLGTASQTKAASPEMQKLLAENRETLNEASKVLSEKGVQAKSADSSPGKPTASPTPKQQKKEVPSR